jgi:hypothetical protein
MGARIRGLDLTVPVRLGQVAGQFEILVVDAHTDMFAYAIANVGSPIPDSPGEIVDTRGQPVYACVKYPIAVG